MITEALIDELVKKRAHLDALRATSPELAEAIAEAEAYAALMAELCERCKQAASPPIMPMPSPVYPPVNPYPYGPYWISNSDQTTCIDPTMSVRLTAGCVPATCMAALH